jgi:hypothetical protein
MLFYWQQIIINDFIIFRLEKDMTFESVVLRLYMCFFACGKGYCEPYMAQ